LGNHRLAEPPVELLAASHAGEVGCPVGESAVTCLPTFAGGEFRFSCGGLGLC
jgi:hypothetical protein